MAPKATLVLAVAIGLALVGAPAPARPVSRAILNKAVQAQVPLAIAELRDMVGIDSGSDNAAGLTAMAAYLETRLKTLGATVERVAVPPASGDLLVATLRGSGKGRFMLLAHMDTVYRPGAVKSWPFAVSGMTATGPGVGDDKGGIAVLLNSLATLRRVGFDGFDTITIAINPDEEIGSPGSRATITKLASVHDYVLSCEPGGRQRILATSGIATLTMHVDGKASHAGVAPELGRNALVVAADMIGRTINLSDPAKGFKFNWTIATSGDRHNIIPDRADAAADMRYIDEVDVTDVMARLQRLAATPAVPDTRVTFQLARNRPPMVPTRSARRMARVAARAGAEFGYPIWILDKPFGGGSDAAYAAASGKAGVVESFGIGSTHGHTYGEETADLASLPASLYIMARTIIALSGH